MKSKRIASTVLLFLLCGLAWATIAAADPALIAARQKFFGAENVDANTGLVRKDKVIISWTSNTTYAVSVMGRVVLLDTFIDRPELAPPPGVQDLRRTPVSAQDLINLHPEALFLGHGHFDHADNAAYISKWLNDIPIYSSPETCDAIQTDVTRMWNDPNAVNGGVRLIPNNSPPNCIGLVSRGSQPGAEIVKIPQLEPLACIVAFKHIHSGSVPVDPAFPHVTINNIADNRDAALYPTQTRVAPNNPPVPGQMAIQITGGSHGPISLFYQFIVRSGYNFSFVWHNTTGPLKEGSGSDPGLPSPAIGQHLFDIMDSLTPTDLELGSVVSLGQTNNGERDVVMYNQHVKPQVYIPGHQTVVALPSSSPEYRIGWFQQNDAMSVPYSQRPELRWLVDPLDYLKPQIFSTGDPRWSNPNKAGRIAQFCS
ncbi:MAG TPA: MBL fold metallo-hydrolase [Casimicrobiaceae bacterium]|jgi:hypothetical protein|nr:MBL fold metallo-hydrolase [Casimicrobiaceae bacterium]